MKNSCQNLFKYEFTVAENLLLHKTSEYEVIVLLFPYIHMVSVISLPDIQMITPVRNNSALNESYNLCTLAAVQEFCWH
jgi:hypothetical protein